MEQGGFKTAEEKLKVIVTSSGAYLLNENVQKYDAEHPYYYGYYTLKIDSKKYVAVVSQLKEIGAVTSFSENRKTLLAVTQSASRTTSRTRKVTALPKDVLGGYRSKR